MAEAASSLAEIRNQSLPPADTVRTMLPSSAVDASTVMGFLISLSYDLESASEKMSFIAVLPCDYNLLFATICSAIDEWAIPT